MRDKLLIVDGHNLLFRMFFGMPDQYYTKSGVRYNAVCGFGSVIVRADSMISPTHMLVVFDSQDCGDRRELDSAYKANRPDYDDAAPNDSPFTQLEAIYALLDELGVPHCEIHGCEADDVIASYAVRHSAEMDIVILSTDRDYWQLISDSVSILDYHGINSRILTPADVEAKYGVSPAQFADFKCLVGDKSDNILGVPGVGPKRAAELLAEFGSLDGIYAHIDEIGRGSTRRALEESRARTELNRTLIKLSGDAPLPYDMDSLAVHGLRRINIFQRAYSVADEHIRLEN